MSSDLVLVTGASGFLAGHVILKLLGDGYRVRGSVRNAARGDNVRAVLEAHGADTAHLSFVELDLLSDKGWAAAMDGVDYLVHTASPFITHIPRHEDDVIRPAVEGTRRALEAALSSEVKRIVLTSSEAAVARGHGKGLGRPLTEADWSNVSAPDMTPYFKSKTLAEREAWAIMEKAGRRADLTVVNPGFILGPLLDTDIGTSGAVIRKMMSGKLPGSPDLNFTVVDVRDAAELHLRALKDERGFGHRLLASGETVGMRQLALALAEAFPAYARRLPTRRLPGVLLRLVGLFDADARAAVRSLGIRFFMEHGLAEMILGRPLVGWREAVVAMGATLVDQKLV
ncbi:MAG: aldehyde reductase [Hyphomicrobiales bacterium]